MRWNAAVSVSKMCGYLSLMPRLNSAVSPLDAGDALQLPLAKVEVQDPAFDHGCRCRSRESGLDGFPGPPLSGHVEIGVDDTVQVREARDAGEALPHVDASQTPGGLEARSGATELHPGRCRPTNPRGS